MYPGYDRETEELNFFYGGRTRSCEGKEAFAPSSKRVKACLTRIEGMKCRKLLVRGL